MAFNCFVFRSLFIFGICSFASTAYCQHAAVRVRIPSEIPGNSDSIYQEGLVSATAIGSSEFGGSIIGKASAIGMLDEEVFRLGISLFSLADYEYQGVTSASDVMAYWGDTLRLTQVPLEERPVSIRLYYQVHVKISAEHSGPIGVSSIGAVFVGAGHLALSLVDDIRNVESSFTDVSWQEYDYGFEAIARDYIEIFPTYDSDGVGMGNWNVSFYGYTNQNSVDSGYVQILGGETLKLTAVTLGDGTPLKDVGITYSFDSQTAVPELSPGILLGISFAIFCIGVRLRPFFQGKRLNL